MRDVLIAAVCLYFAVDFTKSLIAAPISGWGLEHWLLAGLTLIFYVTGGFKAWQAIKAMTVAQRRAKEQAEQIRREAAEERANEED